MIFCAKTTDRSFFKSKRTFLFFVLGILLCACSENPAPKILAEKIIVEYKNHSADIIDKMIALAISANLSAFSQSVNFECRSFPGRCETWIYSNPGVDPAEISDTINKSLKKNWLPTGADLTFERTGIAEPGSEWHLTISGNTQSPAELKKMMEEILTQAAPIQGVLKCRCIGGADNVITVCPDQKKLTAAGLAFPDLVSLIQDFTFKTSGNISPEILARLIFEEQNKKFLLSDVAQIEQGLKPSPSFVYGKNAQAKVTGIVYLKTSSDQQETTAKELERMKQSLPKDVNAESFWISYASDKNDWFSTRAAVPPGMQNNEKRKLAAEMVKKFETIEGVENLFAEHEFSSDDFPENENIIHLFFKVKKEGNFAGITESIKKKANELPGVQFSFLFDEKGRIPNAILVSIQGEDPDLLKQYSEKFSSMFRKEAGILGMEDDASKQTASKEFVIASNKVRENGISISEINSVLSFQNEPINCLRLPSVFVDPNCDGKTDGELPLIYLRNTSNNLVPLSALVEVKLKTGYTFFRRENGKRCFQVKVFALNDEVLKRLISATQNLSMEIKLENGYSIKYEIVRAN